MKGQTAKAVQREPCRCGHIRGEHHEHPVLSCCAVCACERFRSMPTERELEAEGQMGLFAETTTTRRT